MMGKGYWVAFYPFWIFFKLYLGLKAYGQENLPASGGYILASNHLSNLDPMLVGVAAWRKLCFMAKDSLFKNKIFAIALTLVNAFPVKRDSLDIASVKEAIKRLKNAEGLVIFPQGGRRTSHLEDGALKGGLGFLAIKADVPIVPVLISGSDKAMPPKAKFVRPSRVTVRFGRPFKAAKGQDYEEVAQLAMDAIKGLAASGPSLI